MASRRVVHGGVDGDRELDGDGRARALDAVDGEAAAMKLDDGLGEGKTQAHTLIARVVGGPLAVERTDHEIEIFRAECRCRCR